MKFGVQTATMHEFVVGALLDDSAMVQHDDSVCRANGGQSMGDDECRPSFHEFRERPLQFGFGGAVHACGGFIEKHDGGIAV